MALSARKVLLVLSCYLSDESFQALTPTNATLTFKRLRSVCRAIVQRVTEGAFAVLLCFRLVVLAAAAVRRLGTGWMALPLPISHGASARCRVPCAIWLITCVPHLPGLREKKIENRLGPRRKGGESMNFGPPMIFAYSIG